MLLNCQLYHTCRYYQNILNPCIHALYVTGVIKHEMIVEIRTSVSVLTVLSLFPAELCLSFVLPSLLPWPTAILVGTSSSSMISKSSPTSWLAPSLGLPRALLSSANCPRDIPCFSLRESRSESVSSFSVLSCRIFSFCSTFRVAGWRPRELSHRWKSGWSAITSDPILRRCCEYRIVLYYMYNIIGYQNVATPTYICL